MTRLTIPTPLARHALPSSPKLSMAVVSPSINLLVIFIFVLELLTPLLIWKGILPSQVRWFPDVALVVILPVLLLRMLTFDQFPLGFWLIAGVSTLTITQATLQGQAIVTTLWGWWQIFPIILLAIYGYLNPHWSAKFPQRLRLVCVAILVGQLLVQIVQYATGEPVGDNLAGTFGANGVADLLFFSSITICLVLGHSVVTGDWRSFLLVFTLGIVSSVLAENKIFPVAILLLTFLAAGLYLLLGGKLWKLLPYASLFSVGLLLFFVGYNLLVPAAERRTLQQFIFDEETRDSYNQTLRASGNNRVDYNIGRDFAVEFAWNYIWTHTDPSVLVFGLGLGARSESKSFGLLGIALEQDGLGVVRGTGLMNLLQEMGLMGLALVAAYMSSMVYLLLKDIRRYRDSTATELRVALLIFTLLFPLWLWYKPFLFYRVTTVIYWVGIGYVFRQRRYDTFSGAR